MQLQALGVAAMRERAADPGVYGALASTAAFAHCILAKRASIALQIVSSGGFVIADPMEGGMANSNS